MVSVQNGASPAVTLEIDPDDVTCGAGSVVINGQISPDLEGLTSSITLTDVPNGWTVRSSWDVTTPGAGSGDAQTLSLGGVDTPVVNPDNQPTNPAPYVDDVRFAALVDGPAPDAFTYTVTTQLLDDQTQWVGGSAVSVECGGEVEVTTVALDASVPVTVPAGVQSPPEPEAINWGPCDDPDALDNEQCATIEVPLDHFAGASVAGTDSADGIVIELALNRFAASDESEGPLITNPGGPGGSGLRFARGVASLYAGTSLTEDYDIIGMDPRGVANSSPAPFCIPAESSQAGLDNVLDPDWTAHFDDAVPAAAAANTMCSVAGARYLRFLGTRQVAADMDWIRRAEDATRGGDDDDDPLKLHYFGGSYGVRLGEVYLQQFGDNAGNVVLSGAVDPESTYVDWYLGRTGPPDGVAQDLFFPAAPAQTEDQFFEVVQALTPGANQNAGDVAVAAVVDDEATDITLSTFLITLSAALRSEASWPATVAYIADTWANVVGGQSVAIASPPLPEFGDPVPGVADGDGLVTAGDPPQLLVANGESADVDVDAIRRSFNSGLILNVVNCIDLPGVPTTSTQMATLATAAVPGEPVNYLGWPYVPTVASCVGLAVPLGDDSPDKVWPALEFPDDTAAPLVIGSVGDTATPYEWSEALNRFFNDAGIESVLLTYEGAEHVAGVSWPPSGCVYGPIIDLFDDDDLPEPGTTCPFISSINRQPPGGVRAQAGNGEATVTWTPSPQRLGGTVAGFGIEQRQLPDGDWEPVDQSGGACDTASDDPDATSCVVGGLSGDATYEFRMATLPSYEPTPLFSEASNAVTPGAGSPIAQFVDVADGAYFVPATSMLKLRGITTGTNPAGDMFSPLREVNRQQMAALLWRMAGEPDAPDECGFTDQDQIAAFARQAACWLLAENITDNNPFRPLADVDRQQMAALLWRFAGRPDAPDTCGISDEDAIAVWARQAVCWMTDEAITTSNPYQPGNVVNRAQMSAFLYRLGGQQGLWLSGPLR